MSKLITGIVVAVLTSVILAATGWNFKVTAEIPEKYVTKEEQRTFEQKNNSTHYRIEKKLDKIIFHLLGDTDE